MANYNTPNMGMNQQPLIQYPYGNSNMLLNNSPYDNYLNRQSQNLMSNQFLKCRPVSSRDEAQASQIDLDGSLWVFTDLGNDKIYTKKINNDGTASFTTYAKVENEIPDYNSCEYVTKDEFHKVIQNLMAAMQTSGSQDPAPAKSNNDGKTLINF